MDKILKDKRFAHVANDPRFKRIPKNQRKIVIDKRFESMFKDDKFKSIYTVDKRGRPVQHSSDRDLKKYYELSSEEDSDTDDKSEQSDNESEQLEKEDEQTAEENKSIGQFVRAPSPDDLNKEHFSDKKVSADIKKKLRDLNVDYARGEAALVDESSSDDSSDSEQESEENETFEHNWGELDKDAETTDEITNRLAACNMDWDRIRAVDLMVLFNSFLPTGGIINSITIYPSEFGLKRMKEEDLNGPPELTIESSKKNQNKVNSGIDTAKQKNEVEEEESESNDEEDNNEEGSKYHMEKLRQYQLSRLKYYYAVIVCDSANTANKIYTECDHMEYESTATRLDLRFIPDDMTFDQEPKEVCDKLPDLIKYQPRLFTTTALQQAKVDLTWDETNPERLEIAQKLQSGNIDNVTDADIRAYIATSSEDESEDEEGRDEVNDKNEDPIGKYKNLLVELEKEEEEKKNRDVDISITWGVDLKPKTEELVNKKLVDEKLDGLTPFEKYLEKRKLKKKLKRKENKDSDSEDDAPSDIDMNDPYFAEEFNNSEFKKKTKKSKEKPVDKEDSDEEAKRKAELELLILSKDDTNKKHFSLKKILEEENENKTKRKRKKQLKKRDKTTEKDIADTFEVDTKDDRFSALFTNHHFNIDPADPHFRKTKAMEALIGEKIKRRADCDLDEAPVNKLKKTNDINASKVKSDAELNVLIKSIKSKTQALVKKKF